MSNFDENKKESVKPGFTKILSLGDFKSSGSKASSKKVNSESGSVTVEIKRKRIISGSSGSVPLGQSNATGLSQEDLKPKPPNTGIILFTSEELNKYQLCKIVFRENFGEDITIDGVEGDLLFFRDFNSSHYYILKDDKK